MSAHHPAATQRTTRMAVGFSFWCVAVACSPAMLLAGSSSVRFDTNDLVSCRDVTTQEFVAANPHERLIEGRFRVTAIVDNGELPEGTQYIYRLQSPTGQLRVLDYRPKTRQTSFVAGNVSVEKKQERSKSFGLSVTGSFESLVHGTAGADVGDKDSESVHYELKPPMETALVAGTIARGTGVYFKMRPSPERALEGASEFVVVMRVSSQWRGDLMYVHCEAQQNRRGKMTTQGVSRFLVGLYAEGDESARQYAEELVMAEMHLRRTVAEHQRSIQKRAMPSLIHQVGALLDVYDPRIPETWLERLVYGPTDAGQYDFYRHLPDNVRRSADDFRRAKRRMFQLSGGRLAATIQPDSRTGELAVVANTRRP